VTPLQGVRKKLPGKLVTFESGADQIILTSAANGQAIGITGEDGRLAVQHDTAEHGEMFQHTAWGWTSNTLKATSRGQYVTLSEMETLTASAEEIYGWFVKESLNIVPEAEGKVSLRTWNDKLISVNAEDGTLQVADQDASADARLFKKNIVTNGIEAAVEAAKAAEVAVVFVGNHPLLNGKEEIDRPDIVLPEEQECLVKAVYEANPNTVVVIVGSYPISSAWIDENIPAVLYTSHSGQELGNAVAEVLFGDYSPSGKLNMTWFRSVEQLPELMDYDIIKGKRTYMYFDGKPLYPFGHGLSYAEVTYKDLNLSTEDLQQNDTLNISVQVDNNGAVDGDEVVQLYVQALNSRVKRPIKQLKGFEKASIAAGQSHTVEFALPVTELAFWDVTREQYCIENGEYAILIGRSSADIKLSSIVKVKGDIIPSRNLYNNTKAENYDDYEGVYLDECKAGGASIHPVKEGAWITFNDVLFDHGAVAFEAVVSSTKGGSIEIRTGSTTGKLVGTLNVPSGGVLQQWSTLTGEVSVEPGTADVYVVFNGEVLLSRFQFNQ
jgi:beta-glucosidase